jgi:hypothetical protein
MSDRKTAILGDLDQTRQSLIQVLDSMAPDDWEKTIQEADQHWTVRQIVAHLVDAQRGMTGQISKINAGEEPIPPDFDLSRWNKRAVEKSADKSSQELLKALEDGRVALKQAVETLTDADLDKQGRHSSLEIMSLEQIARLIGAHEAEHAAMIAQKLGA